MTARYEVFTDKDGLFRFQLKGANGHVLADSPAYTRLEHVREGMGALQRAAAEAPIPDDDAGIDLQTGIHMHFALRPPE